MDDASSHRGVLDADLDEGDNVFDIALRPRTLDEYIGQTKHKDNLKVYIEAAKRRGEPLDHVLLCGPPGLGKTTLAYIVAAVPARDTNVRRLLEQADPLRGACPEPAALPPKSTA